MIKSQNKPIFITGVPRSGTTWIANILGSAKGVRLLSEPDNEKYSFIGRIWKKSLHRFPFADSENGAISLIKFYQKIFSGAYPRNRSLVNHFLNGVFQYNALKNESHIFEKEDEISNTEIESRSINFLTTLLYCLTADVWNPFDRLLIKSVHSGLCLPVINNHFNPDMVLVFRHPANIISSYTELKIEDANRNIFRRPELSNFLKNYQDKIRVLNDPLSFMGLQIGIFYHLWEKALETHNQWIETSHEDLCEDSVEKYKSLFDQLNIVWDSSAQNWIEKMNQPGEGFKTYRIAKDLKDKWKKRLNTDQIIKIQKGYSILPVKHYDEFKI